MSTILQPVPQPQVTNYLDLIEPGLQRIHELSDGRLSVSSLRQKLFGGFWLLWLAYADSKYIGFVATEFDKRDNGSWVVVPLAYAQPGHNGSLWEGVEQLKGYAKSLEAEGLEFETSRPEWEAMAPRLGFQWVSARWGLSV